MKKYFYAYIVDIYIKRIILVLQIILPLHTCGNYIMFSFDMKERSIYIIDKMHIPYWGPKDDPSKYYLDGIQKIGITLGRAMEETDPTWNDDVYDWRRKIPIGVPKTTDR